MTNGVRPRTAITKVRAISITGARGACAGIITARVKPGDDDEAECGHER
jgi:hypothetical protein